MAVPAPSPKLLGHQLVPCTIAGVQVDINFLVVENLAHQVLLGNSFFTRQQAVMDHQRSCLHFGVDRRTTVFWRSTSSPSPQVESPAPRECLTPNDIKHDFPEELIPELEQLLKDFSTVFSTDPRPSVTHTVKHTIRLKKDQPFRLRPYRYTDAKKKIIQEEVDRLLKLGIIERSSSDYASPIVIVTKKDGRPRMCIDFRRLNDLTEDEIAPLPNISETIRDLGTAKVFTAIDLKQGYHQVPLDPDSKKYTAFATPDGALYQYTVMPFGLKNAPSTFQRLMVQEVLPAQQRKQSMVFLDDIIVYSEDHKSHLVDLRQVLEQLSAHNLQASVEKCHLGASELNYLGHVVSAEGNKPQETHVAKVREALPPTNRKELRQFLGVCNWLREFVPNMAALAKPLTDLLSARRCFKWTPEHQASFDALKDALASPGCLARPDPNKRFFLQTDACQIGMGAVLYQENDDGSRRVISYASAKFSQAETRYAIHEQECLAVVWAIRRYRPYLEDKPFTLRTDNKALTWLNNSKDHKAKLTRWAILLQQFNFTIEHVAGSSNELPDVLSRNPDEVERTEDEEDDLLPDDGVNTLAINLLQEDEVPPTLADEVRRAQDDDNTTRDLIALRRRLEEEDATEDWHPAFKSNYAVIDGYLHFTRGGHNRLYVPQRAIERVLYEHHDSQLAIHPGAEETINSIQEQYHWPQVAADTRDYVRTCLLCARYKRTLGLAKAEQRPRAPQRPFEVLAVDLMGPYNTTRSGNRFILVITDLFTRWVEAYPIPRASADIIIKVMVDEVFSRYGYPASIISDNGSQFTSARWDRACRHWRVQHFTTSDYHPRANPTERRNQEVKKTLKMMMDRHPLNEWDTRLPAILFSLRRRKNAATGQAPSQLVLGRKLPMPGSWTGPDPPQPAPAEDRNNEAREHQAEYILRRHQVPDRAPPLFEPGELVLVQHPPITGSFNPKYEGPFAIVRRLEDDVNYVVNIRDQHRTYHVDRLKKAPVRQHRWGHHFPNRPLQQPPDNAPLEGGD